MFIKKSFYIFLFLGLFFINLNAHDEFFINKEWNIKKLREVYSKDSSKWPKADVDKGIDFEELKAISKIDETNINKALVKLGKRLFHEPRLSKSEDISCATCHVPNNAFIQRTALSKGHKNQVGNRNAPTLFGLQDLEHLFWDGRANSLEEQAIGPILNPVEMALSKDELKAKLETLSGYVQDSENAFGSSGLNIDRLAKAIAAFERTLKAPRTRFDDFMEGNEKAFNDYELLGLHLFRTKARCMNCHYGENLTDGKFHNLGLTYYGRSKFEDFGRYNVTKNKDDMGKFKTPTLRQISNTMPYMHGGFFDSLSAVINIYNAGAFQPKPNNMQINDPLFPKTSPLLKKLNLTRKEMIALKLFLNTL